MSKIDDLIQELCPDGVEYKALGDVGNFIRGQGLQKKDFTSHGIGCIHYGQIYTYYKLFTSHTLSFVRPELAGKLRHAHTNDLIIATTSENDEDVCKAVAWLGESDIVVSGDAYIYRHSMNPKYVSYVFQSSIFQEQKQQYITGTKVRRLSGESMAKIRVPVPPLPVQKEIVRILDSFTSLEAELEAELEARRKQYEYYRDQLLTFRPSAEREARWLTLAEMEDAQMIKLGRGKVISKRDIENNPGDYPVYSSSAAGIGEFGRYGDYLFDDERITWSIDGGGRFFYRPAERYSVTNVSGWLKVLDQAISTKFLFYELETLWTKKTFDYTKKAHPSVIRREYTIAIPPLEEQQRIVSILDKFDGLVSNLSSGLPAEIAARRKQYEFYRDQLLTFKELGA